MGKNLTFWLSTYMWIVNKDLGTLSLPREARDDWRQNGVTSTVLLSHPPPPTLVELEV